MTLVFWAIFIMSVMYCVASLWRQQAKLALLSVVLGAFMVSLLMFGNMGAEFGTARLIAFISACLLFSMVTYDTIVSMSNSRKGSRQEAETEQHVQASKVN